MGPVSKDSHNGRTGGTGVPNKLLGIQMHYLPRVFFQIYHLPTENDRG